jgi:hypothetical protein
VQRAPGLPRALFFLGASDLQNFGRNAPRDRERTSINVIARIKGKRARQWLGADRAADVD